MIDECEVIIGGFNYCCFIVSCVFCYILELGYVLILILFYNFYECFVNFCDLVNYFSKNFVYCKNVERICFVELFKKYLLEELVVISCLIVEGWIILVYLGELNVFDEIVNGLYFGVFELFK